MTRKTQRVLGFARERRMTSRTGCLQLGMCFGERARIDQLLDDVLGMNTRCKGQEDRSAQAQKPCEARPGHGASRLQ